MYDNSPPILKAVWSGTFHLFGVEVRCHVLEDGQRIVEEESMGALLEAMMEEAILSEENELEAFAKWQKGLP